jgi:transcriptional regulator with XRE-family HTH domain
MELSGRLGISKQHLSDIETGRKLVSPERAFVWAKALGQVELHWAQLALQDWLDKTPLKVKVHLEAA